MSEQTPNWKVEFQNASGGQVFEAKGYKSPMTMDLVTEDTFIRLGLIEMEKQDALTQGFGCDVEPLMNTWEKAVVNAEDFGITDFEVAHAELDADLFNSARDQAYQEMQNNSRSRVGQRDVAGGVFDFD